MILFTLLIAVVSSTTASGSAFSIPQLGTRASGLGTAFVAVADDGSALFFNPAGIAFQPGTRIEMDALLLGGHFRYFPSSVPPGTIVPSDGYNGLVSPSIIPAGGMYFTHQWVRKAKKGPTCNQCPAPPDFPRWTFGFGLFTPFGLASNFTSFKDSDPVETKFVGRYAGTRGGLQVLWAQPTIAYRLTENSSLAVGVAFVHTHLLIEESFLNPGGPDALDFGREAASTVFPGVDTEQAAASIARMLPEGRFRVAGTANSPGFNAGYLYKSRRYKTNFGASWRSAVINHLKGKASFAFTTDYTLKQFVGPDFIPKAFPTQNVTGSFATPATFSIGFANSSIGKNLISFEARLQDYTRFKYVPLNFQITSANDPDVKTPLEKDLFFNFHDEIQIAAGWERPLKGMVVRAGYVFDRNPVPDQTVGPFFPDSNRHTVGGGLSKMIGSKEMSLFFEDMRFVTRTIDVPSNAFQYTNGQYKNSAWLFGFGMRMHIGREPNQGF